jgi:hypothetical protein
MDNPMDTLTHKYYGQSNRYPHVQRLQTIEWTNTHTHNQKIINKCNLNKKIRYAHQNTNVSLGCTTYHVRHITLVSLEF